MITKVRDKVKKFLKETVEAEAIRIVTIDKDDEGWVAEAEVAEKNQYLASIKPQYRVFEKERYVVRLDADLEITSYKRVRHGEEALEV